MYLVPSKLGCKATIHFFSFVIMLKSALVIGRTFQRFYSNAGFRGKADVDLVEIEKFGGQLAAKSGR